MVVLLVIAICLLALTADYVVQRLARPVPAIAVAPEGLFVDAGHIWLAPEPTGLARLGADEAAGVLLGRPERIEWQPAGPVTRGAPLAVLHGKGRRLTLRSPVDGVVVEQNTSLTERPSAVASEPFGAGWLVRLRPADLKTSVARMQTGERLIEWSRQEMDRLRAFVLERLPQPATVGATAADGGPLGPELASQLDAAAWDEAARMLFDAGAQDEASAKKGARS